MKRLAPDIDTPDDAPVKKLLATIGWREWVTLPDLEIKSIKAKVDTGARTSALHAFNIHYVHKHGRTFVQFEVHPLQRNSRRTVHCEAPLVEERFVTDSGGKRTLRPVIETRAVVGTETLLIELTLTSRDEMGFRMLLGRQAMRGRFLVHSGRSYLGGRRKKKSKKKVKAKP
jgi:hypothetical protein